MSYKPRPFVRQAVFHPSVCWTGNIFENIERYAPLVCAEFREGAAARRLPIS
jgi:hypothetical protein